MNSDSNNNLYNKKSGRHDTTYQVNPIVLCKVSLKCLNIVVAISDNQKDGVMPLIVILREEGELSGVRLKSILGTTEKT